jgi:AcrR family transcriptional regulator
MATQRSAVRSVTEVRILEAAAQLFARHGFKAATTREIAQLAGLNQVTLFRYFLHKPDLFWAAVESRLSRVKLGRDLQASLETDQEPSVVVPKIVTFLLQSLARQPDLHRLLHVAAFELPGSDKVIREFLGPIFDVVNGYFERCVRRELIPPLAASLPTLGILGTVVAHASLYPLLTGKPLPVQSLEQEAAAYADVWMRALTSNRLHIAPCRDNRVVKPPVEDECVRL